jgi:hypothetical protein
MPLFYSRNRTHHFHPDGSRPPRSGLPEFMKHLNIRCQPKNSHELAVRMVFLAETLNDRGWPIAIYQCSMHGCDWREGWVVDWNTGEARRLFGRNHKR